MVGVINYLYLFSIHWHLLDDLQILQIDNYP